MPHFGISNYQFRNAIDTAKTYKITAWLAFKQEWREGIGYDKMTPEEISVCRKLFEQLAQHPGLQLQIYIDERLRDVDDYKQYPRVARMNLYVGNAPKPEYQTQQNDEKTFDQAMAELEAAEEIPAAGKGFGI
tara:strand:- start:47 stop:445 length:399 start_codon:yes stop_codon:yes gene_type:complete